MATYFSYKKLYFKFTKKLPLKIFKGKILYLKLQKKNNDLKKIK